MSFIYHRNPLISRFMLPPPSYFSFDTLTISWVLLSQTNHICSCIVCICACWQFESTHIHCLPQLYPKRSIQTRSEQPENILAKPPTFVVSKDTGSPIAFIASRASSEKGVKAWGYFICWWDQINMQNPLHDITFWGMGFEIVWIFFQKTSPLTVEHIISYQDRIPSSEMLPKTISGSGVFSLWNKAENNSLHCTKRKMRKWITRVLLIFQDQRKSLQDRSHIPCIGGGGGGGENKENFDEEYWRKGTNHKPGGGGV